MQFLYTGATTYNAVQTNADLSLGGFISNTIIPNNSLNNVFSDISWLTAARKKVEVKGIILKNTLGIDAVDVVVGYVYPQNANFKLEIAFVTLNPSDLTQIERIPNSEASPYFATFAEANIDLTQSIDNSIDIGALTNGSSIAVWLRRTITGIFQPPTFASVDDEIAYWQQASDPNFSNTKITDLQLKVTTNQ